ncbi:MAG: helix-turn-helix domain-containing protein [Deltaproteobacteria bacterium]|nr:helix-turn-helix domain-containing protein [Deltaproteobacteria bacterium]
MPRKIRPETPLYVKLPNDAVEKLHRAAEALGVAKKDLVTQLVKKYVDPDTQKGLASLGGTMMGSYSFHPYDPPEVMNAEQAGQFLQIDEKNVIELAEAGKLPGKKLGPVWRFSREALVAWLSTPSDPKEGKR